jgi:hypothetical protein
MEIDYLPRKETIIKPFVSSTATYPVDFVVISFMSLVGVSLVKNSKTRMVEHDGG